MMVTTAWECGMGWTGPEAIEYPFLEIHPSYPEMRMEWFRLLWKGNLGYSPPLVPFLGDFFLFLTFFLTNFKINTVAFFFF